MIKSDLTLSEAIAQFDPSPTNPVAEGYRAQRAELPTDFYNADSIARGLGDWNSAAQSTASS